MRIDKIIQSINDALEKHCYLPALVMTLILPDICAQYEYPRIYKKKESYENHSGQGAAYAKWYDENIRAYEIPTFPETDFLTREIGEQHNVLNQVEPKGRDIWKLRCGLFHDGSIDLDDLMSDKKEIKIRFVLSAHPNSGIRGGGMVYYQEAKIVDIDLDVATFCKKILSVLEYTYLNDNRFIKWQNEKKLNFINWNDYIL